MKRGELYRIDRPTKQDPKRFRVYVIVSRQRFVESAYDSVICAPLYTNYNGLLTEVNVGIDEGLKHDSSIRCDELTSLPKSALTNFIRLAFQAKDSRIKLGTKSCARTRMSKAQAQTRCLAIKQQKPSALFMFGQKFFERFA